MKKTLLLVFALLAATSVAIRAQETNSMPDFAPEIRRVAVFKNGYAFTYREGEARTANGWTYTARTPIGVLGTVWGYATTPNARVMQLLASEGERNTAERVTNIAEFLLANEGAQVRISPNFLEGEKSFAGTYELLKPGEAFLNRPVNNQYSYGYANHNINELTVALKTANGTMVFPATTIKTVEVIGQAKTALMKKSNRLALKIEGARDGQPVGVGIAALERGIRWIPAYRVEVKGDPIKEAKLELEAMLINELADLQNSEVYFVVGVPSFVFQEAISPLSMNTAFAGVSSYFQTGGRRGENRNAYSNAIASQVAYVTSDTESEYSIQQPDATPTISTEERSPSLSAEQLFLYKTNNLALRKGERTSLRLFSLTVPASEVFEWTISDPPQTEQNYLNPSYQNQNQNRLLAVEDLSNRIWYALRLKNKTEMPWTTAPALSFREWKPMGQNLLSFTPIGGENILRVTPATEVTGTHRLEEKERVREQIRYSGSTYDFDLVTIEGTVRVRNVKKQPVEIVLTRNVVGDVISATDNGAISREGLNLQAVNPNSIVKWNLTLAPGDKEIKYSYKIYVRK